MPARPLPLVAALIGAGALAWSAEPERIPMRDLSLFWDFAPQRFDLEVEDSFGRRLSRGGEFDDNDRIGLRYMAQLGPVAARSGLIGGGEIAYADYDDDDLDYKSLSFSGLFGYFIHPRPWWRGSIHARLGLAFSEADIPASVFDATDLDNRVLSYGTTGIQYAAGVTSDFLLGPTLMASVILGFQGEYASAVSWWYYYDYPETSVEVATYGGILAAAVGARF